MKVLAFFVVFLLVITVIPHSTYAQSNSNKVNVIDGHSKYKYSFQDKLYTKDELGFLFKENAGMYLAYEKAVKKLNDGKKLGYFTLGVIGVSSIAIAVDNNIEGEAWFSTGDKIGIFGIFVLVPISGTAALIKNFDGKSKLKMVLKIFNELHADKYGRKIEQPTIEFSSRGVGLQLRF